MINGATYVTGALIGSGQGANCNKQIIVNGAMVKLTDINNGSSGDRRCTCGVFTLDGMDGSSGMWSLMARIGKVFRSLQGSHANNTNVSSSSGHAGENIGWLEVVG